MSVDRSPIAIRCFRYESWMRKARDISPSDIDARFIFLWIAFNALYGQPKYLKREPGCEIYGLDEEMDIKKFVEVISHLDRKSQIRTELEPLKQDIDELTKDLFLNKQCWIGWYKRELQSVDERVKRPFFCRKTRRRPNGIVSKPLCSKKSALSWMFHYRCRGDEESRGSEEGCRSARHISPSFP